MDTNQQTQNQIDKDIAQCKADILRASGAKNTPQKPNSVDLKKPVHNIQEIKPAPKQPPKVEPIKPAIKTEAKPRPKPLPIPEKTDISAFETVEDLMPTEETIKPKTEKPFELAQDLTEGDPDTDIFAIKTRTKPRQEKPQTPIEKTTPVQTPPKDIIEDLILSDDDDDADQTDIFDIAPSQPAPTEDSTPNEPDKPDEQIPQFNLAEQILTEQRKAAATRRKAPGPKNNGDAIQPVSGTMAQIISETKKPPVNNNAQPKTDPDTDKNEEKPAPSADQIAEKIVEGVEKITQKAAQQLKRHSHYVHIETDQFNGRYQKIVAGIVAKDISRLCNARPGH